MFLSDDDKRQIMYELAQGNVSSLREVPPLYPEEAFDPKDYPTFDDFAQRPSREQWQFFDQLLDLDSDFTKP